MAQQSDRQVFQDFTRGTAADFIESLSSTLARLRLALPRLTTTALAGVAAEVMVAQQRLDVLANVVERFDADGAAQPTPAPTEATAAVPASSS